MDAQLLFGKRVRSVREAAGLSREVVAERTSTTANYLGEIERGEKWPSLDIIVQLAHVFSVSPSVFFEFDSEERDLDLLHARLQQILSSRDTEEIQTAIRVLKALFQL